MKAIICTRYGPPDVLQLRDVDKPTPRDNEVLIKVHATSVTLGDCEIRSFKVPDFVWLPMRLYMGIRKPRLSILGQELAGRIEAVGKDVTQFKVGDDVFAETGMFFGGYAEYACLPENSDMATIAHMPTNLSYEEAAVLPVGGKVALHFISAADLKPGQRILINGAGGSIGTLAIQLAKHAGAHVTAVDSTPKLAMLRSLGADAVIDYTQEDFTRNGQTYDVIFDVVGKAAYGRAVKMLNAGGRFLMGNPRFSLIMQGLWTRRTSDKRVSFGLGVEDANALLTLKEMVEAGKLKPVIDKRYPLAQMVEAHYYVEGGHKMGNVVINVASA